MGDLYEKVIQLRPIYELPEIDLFSIDGEGEDRIFSLLIPNNFWKGEGEGYTLHQYKVNELPLTVASKNRIYSDLKTTGGDPRKGFYDFGSSNSL